MSLTASQVRHALERLAAVYPAPKDPSAAFAEWSKALRDPWLVASATELELAVTRFIRETEKTYGFPIPGQIVALIKAGRGAPAYTEPESAEPCDPTDIRKAWEEAGIDLEDLRRRSALRDAR